MHGKITKVLAVLVISAIFLSAILVYSKHIVRADTEPNDSFAQAELITPGTYSGTVDESSDYDDYYKIVVSAGQTINANVTPAASLQVWFGLYDPTQTEVKSDAPNMGVMAEFSWTTNSAQASYTYYILVEASSGSGAYTLNVSLISQNDGNSGGDAGDTFDTATQLTSTNATYPGFLKDLDLNDYYKLTLTAGQTISVNATPTSTLQVWLGLYDPARNQKVSDSPNMGLMASVSWTTNSAQASYTYYVLVYVGNGYGHYSMEVAIVGQDDAGSGGDAGDTVDTPTPLATGTFYGLLKDDDINDCYRLVKNVTAGQSLYVTVIPSAAQALQVYIYDEAKNQQNYGTANPGVAVVLSIKAQSTQLYYIRVNSGSKGNYTMRVTAEPYVDVPTFTPTNPTIGQDVKVSVSVTASQNGLGPVTLWYMTGASWTNVTMALNTTTSLYEGIIPGFQSATTVYYKIIAYDTAGDYFVQDNAGLYYTIPVVPEFSTLTMMLFLICMSASLAILLRRKNKR